nr:hypothetical protein [Mycobacterium eburneum]
MRVVILGALTGLALSAATAYLWLSLGVADCMIGGFIEDYQGRGDG